MSKLKKCPFCGGEAEKFKDVSFVVENGEKIGEKMWFVCCTECSALVSGSTEQEVSDQWNRRIDNNADL